MTSRQEIADFCKILDAWRFGYTSVLCKYFVSKKGNDAQLLYGVFAFTNPEISNNMPDIRVETSQCIAGQETFPLSAELFDTLRASITSEPYVLRTKNEKFKLNLKNEQNLSYQYEPLDFPLINSFMRNPFLRVSAYSDQNIIPDIKTTSLELRNLDTPYDDLQDLFYTLGLSMDILQDNRIPNIQYIATMPLENMSCTIENQSKLHLNFSFPQCIDPSKFKVGVRLFRKDKSDPRFHFTGDQFQWSENNGSQQATLTRQIEKLEIARVFPSYAGHNIGAYVTVDPKLVINNRTEVDNVFFDGQNLSNFLSSKNADEFEFGVATLLHQLKLSVQKYAGIKTLTNSPDLIAFSQSGHIYIIECTTGSPNHKGKLLKLHRRTEKLIQHYAEKGLSSELIRPIIFTNLPRDNTNEDHGDLMNFKISLVTKDDFEEFFKRTSTPPSDQDFFNLALKAIPVRERDKRF